MTLKRNPDARLKSSRALLDASGDDLRILLLFTEDPTQSEAALAEAAGCSLSRVSGSLAYWHEAGILVEETAEKRAEAEAALPDRSGEELAALLLRAPTRAELLNEIQLLLGHTLTQNEINTVLGLMEDYCVDEGYILALLSYCKEMKKGSIRYMEKTALSLIDSGVDTLALLDSYLKKKRSERATARTVQRIFGIADRPLSKKEKQLTEAWALYGYGEDIIGLAYDITVDATNKSSLPYADKILSHWHAAGLRTLAECEAFLEREREARKAAAVTPREAPKRKPMENKSFDTEDFFQKALERSYQTDKGSEESK